MNNKKLIALLDKFKNNEITRDELLNAVYTVCQDSEVKLDYLRMDRCGFPEFIYGAGKTPSTLVSIVKDLYERQETILVTRLKSSVYDEIKNSIPKDLKYDPIASVLYFKGVKDIKTKKGCVSILTGGTTDIPVALEAKYTVEMCGYKTQTYFDVGVAGIHRLMNYLDEIRKCDVIIAIAGMEGALPSVVAGLVSKPVIAVPTSIGYGTSLNGLTPLFAMLNSCANGIVVVNIDNGFGAACAAVRFLNTAS